MARRPKVRFLYRSSGGYLGSTQMRGFQLCDLARDQLGDRYDFAMQPVPNLQKLRIEGAWIAWQPRGVIYFIVKDAVDRFSPEGLQRLHAKAAGTALDYVDRHLHIMPPRGIDLHIAASISGTAAMMARIAEVAGTDEAIDGQVMRLMHGVDHRLYALPKARDDRFRPVYFGSPHVTTMPDAIARSIDIIDATTTEKMAENFARVSGYNFHYGIRKIVQYPHIRGRKPFTKAFTAAVLGANILTHADEDEALPVLGPNYPYMTASTNHGEVSEMMDKARRTFGGPEWRAAEIQMQRLADMVSFKAQAAELDAILRRLLS